MLIVAFLRANVFFFIIIYLHSSVILFLEFLNLCSFGSRHFFFLMSLSVKSPLFLEFTPVVFLLFLFLIFCGVCT